MNQGALIFGKLYYIACREQKVLQPNPLLILRLKLNGQLLKGDLYNVRASLQLLPTCAISASSKFHPNRSKSVKIRSTHPSVLTGKIMLQCFFLNGEYTCAAMIKFDPVQIQIGILLLDVHQTVANLNNYPGSRIQVRGTLF